MEIKNVSVHGLEESVVASGYPKSTEIGNIGDKIWGGRVNYQRAGKLANNPPGTGHNNFLSGITVQFDIKAPQYWWLQAERYHFLQIISSQSKMHRILEMDISKQCNKYVSKRIIDEFERIIAIYNEHIRESDKYLKWQTKQEIEKERKELFQKVIANCPMGLELTARISTNYLQLKTIYSQRKNHRLVEWKKVCNWIEGLPHSEWITNNGS